MAPELQILTINAVCLGVAYLVILPGLTRKTLKALALSDLAVSVLALGTAGMLFWGSGVRFSLLLVEVNWLVFALVTFALMEVPLFMRFVRKHGIEPPH
ncbi:MAG: hypothetical protein JJU15_16485 [Pararhodobacter sp.]|nr:hypothetical protein [Pararhodobacter sp.]